MTNYPIRLILDNLRSTANVGSILRTAEGCGVELLYLTGYTPYPLLPHDDRPPHIADSNHRAIAKTALGAEALVPLRHTPDTITAIQEARSDGFTITILEQAENSLTLKAYKPDGPVALVLGREVEGVSLDTLALADYIVEIPMLGQKESYGVAVAAGMALYQLRYGC
jgi:23S rRNA (guanosine2251-2'-O)-methyltransferase